MKWLAVLALSPPCVALVWLVVHAANTDWAILVGLGAVVAVFGTDSAVRARRRASYVIRHAQRMDRAA